MYSGLVREGALDPVTCYSIKDGLGGRRGFSWFSLPLM